MQHQHLPVKTKDPIKKQHLLVGLTIIKVARAANTVENCSYINTRRETSAAAASAETSRTPSREPLCLMDIVHLISVITIDICVWRY